MIQAPNRTTQFFLQHDSAWVYILITNQKSISMGTGATDIKTQLNMLPPFALPDLHQFPLIMYIYIYMIIYVYISYWYNIDIIICIYVYVLYVCFLFLFIPFVLLFSSLSPASSLASCLPFFLGGPSSPVARLSQREYVSLHLGLFSKLDRTQKDLVFDDDVISDVTGPLLSDKDGKCCLWRLSWGIVEELQRHYLSFVKHAEALYYHNTEKEREREREGKRVRENLAH